MNHTHFHTLGIPPATDKITVAATYRQQVLELLPESLPGKGSMAYGQTGRRIIELTNAFIILSHGEKRDAYVKTLEKACMICSLCNGRGKIDMSYGCELKYIPCIACGGTGWAFQVEDK